ncbi:hypothetical protein MBAV_004377 [Candidatus Magnetobacterium bavaricum]|uniref:Uncharacterized protein n=1 Tax=Candidatus Magnetobacterium bavaricum TaxID=29290 RepID=A0A0F3GN79_9BACT|nr:hypothetical protein MBAV_004377 [Candidatus Magnetobacterium bavaricum]
MRHCVCLAPLSNRCLVLPSVRHNLIYFVHYYPIPVGCPRHSSCVRQLLVRSAGH